MKNKEKYQKEIVKIACEGRKFAVHINGNLCPCVKIACTNCKFCSNSGCEENRKNWAETEAEPELTEQEKKTLRMLDPKWKYIARDKRGRLCIYKYKPEREDTYWDDGEEWAHIESLFAECDFAAIKWEDKEPWEITKLIADRRLKCEK